MRIREVFVQKHVPGFAGLQKRVKEAVRRAKLKKMISEGDCQERPKPLKENQGALRRHEAADRRLRELSGAIKELEELLERIAEAKSDMAREQNAGAAVQEKRRASDVSIRDLVSLSLRRRRSDSKNGTVNEEHNANEGDYDQLNSSKRGRKSQV